MTARPTEQPALKSDKTVTNKAQSKPQVASQSAEPHTHKGQWRQVTVKAGDNLSLVFQRLGLSRSDLHGILELGELTANLKRIRPNQTLHFLIVDGELMEMIHEQDLINSLRVRKVAGRFTADIVSSEPEIHIAGRSGEIDSSLFLAGQGTGLSDKIIMQLANIFGWDIDFVMDIRKGDSFAVIYEELYKKESKVGDGNILAAQFKNRGTAYRAVRFIDGEGHADYYSDQGHSMRKTFLRTPVNFSRISSRFNPKRKHPILNKIRAHRGVDYAAPHGTPVKATGDGRISFVGARSGYGKTIILQHGGKYTTLYAHLSRFSHAAKHGKRVLQGETIGYVGKTGLATGPHLHYEFRISGVHHNPLTVMLPKTKPLPNKYLADFKMKSEPLLAQLDRITRGQTTSSVVRGDPQDATLGEASEKLAANIMIP
jgi:murein DD-endopeptidase MepM/ murein hydrolase activator NlpD